MKYFSVVDKGWEVIDGGKDDSKRRYVMRKIFLSFFFYFLLVRTAFSLPILYDLTGQKTADGMGTLIGSYIYDPASNIYYDQNIGAVYTTMPTITDYATLPKVTINLTADRSATVVIWLNGNISYFADVSGGSMPLYYLGTDLKLSIYDPSSWTGQYAIRLANVYFYGNGTATGPVFDFGHDAQGNHYIPYASPLFPTLERVQVLEPSSLLLLGSGIAVLGMWRRRILKHSDWGG